MITYTIIIASLLFILVIFELSETKTRQDPIFVKSINPETEEEIYGILKTCYTGTYVDVLFPSERYAERISIYPGCWERLTGDLDIHGCPIMDKDLVLVTLPEPFGRVRGLFFILGEKFYLGFYTPYSVLSEHKDIPFPVIMLEYNSERDEILFATEYSNIDLSDIEVIGNTNDMNLDL